MGEALSRKGSRRRWLVGRMTISVKGITVPRRRAPTSHRAGAPCSQAAIAARVPRAARAAGLHYCGALVAGGELGEGYGGAALHAGGMLDEGDVEGGAGEEARGEEGQGFREGEG
jgi:hypothetical protein